MSLTKILVASLSGLSIVFMCLLLIPRSPYALPRYSVEEGVNCLSCHVNPTGSGKRNDRGGRLFSQDLSLTKTRGVIPTDLKGRIAPFLSLGASIRPQNMTTLGNPKNNNFTIPQASLYTELNAGKYLLGYVDYDFANTYNRETFVMLHNLPLNFYTKIGRMSLPYGLKVEDGTSFTRANFNMTFANQDVGLELGVMPGDFEWVVAVSNGVPGGVADENLAKAVTSSFNWVSKFGRIGGSFHFNRRPANDLLFSGINGGFHIWRLIFLGEFDWQRIRSRTGAGTTTLFAGLGEMDLKIIEGFYARTVYDFLEPDRSVTGDWQHRLGLGFDLYPIPYGKFSLIYRMNVGPGVADDDQVVATVNFFF